MAQCPNKDVNLPKRFAKTQCREEENHETPHRYEMNDAEVAEWFQKLNQTGGF